MRLYVRLTPKSSVERIDGWDMDDKGRRFLKVRVRAAPIEGKANEALIAFLAKSLKVPKSRLTLVAGIRRALNRSISTGWMKTRWRLVFQIRHAQNTYAVVGA